MNQHGKPNNTANAANWNKKNWTSVEKKKKKNAAPTKKKKKKKKKKEEQEEEELEKKKLNHRTVRPILYTS